MPSDQTWVLGTREESFLFLHDGGTPDHVDEIRSCISGTISTLMALQSSPMGQSKYDYLLSL